jgi:hypothetical protein
MISIRNSFYTKNCFFLFKIAIVRSKVASLIIIGVAVPPPVLVISHLSAAVFFLVSFFLFSKNLFNVSLLLNVEFCALNSVVIFVHVASLFRHESASFFFYNRHNMSIVEKKSFRNHSNNLNIYFLQF